MEAAAGAGRAGRGGGSATLRKVLQGRVDVLRLAGGEDNLGPEVPGGEPGCAARTCGAIAASIAPVRAAIECPNCGAHSRSPYVGHRQRDCRNAAGRCYPRWGPNRRRYVRRSRGAEPVGVGHRGGTSTGMPFSTACRTAGHLRTPRRDVISRRSGGWPRPSSPRARWPQVRDRHDAGHEPSVRSTGASTAPRRADHARQPSSRREIGVVGGRKRAEVLTFRSAGSCDPELFERSGAALSTSPPLAGAPARRTAARRPNDRLGAARSSRPCAALRARARDGGRGPRRAGCARARRA